MGKNKKTFAGWLKTLGRKKRSKGNRAGQRKAFQERMNLNKK